MDLYTHRTLITELIRIGIVKRMADPNKKDSYKYLYYIV